MLFFKTFLQIFPDCWVCSEGSKCPRRLFLLLPAVSCRHLYCLNCKEAGDDTGRCDCVSPSCVSLRAPPSDPVLWWSSVQSHGGRQRQAALRGLRLSAAAHRMVSSSCSEKHILLCSRRKFVVAATKCDALHCGIVGRGKCACRRHFWLGYGLFEDVNIHSFI